MISIIKAVRAKDVAKVRELIFNHQFSYFERMLAFVEAAEQGELEIVQLFINTGVDVNEEVPLLRSTALTQAASEGHVEVVNLLLQLGALPERPRRNPRDKPALMLAAQEGHLSIVKILVEAGANVNLIAGSDSDYALYSAASGGHEEIFNYLYPLTNPELRQAALDLLPEGIRMRTIEETADPLAIDLTTAVFNENLEEVRQILASGADVNRFNDMGTTALFFAVRKQSIELVQCLLEVGADPNKSNLDDGKTPLMITHGSWREQSVQICSLLLESGANSNARDVETGKTVLMHNVGIPASADELFKVNCRRIVQKILQHGADVNAKDNDGNTALSIAKKAGNTEIIQLLKEAGAEEN
ncbi:ankyrin repeat domain-containing protein [Oscillatoria salina]|uniref:ankyrin repeat domain-containing protein n=1 Tax=Oscillatoria salina TaxID=331517 RepID=UPI001CCBFA30|nr:ankyrin repeat domain-containing protein [Oscillatoria salina]MBZ8182743.1 ankyrin repeat domain-containing protein [Oscillatoria salina IIICB1]